MARRKKQEEGADHVVFVVLQLLELAEARNAMTKEEFLGYWGLTEEGVDDTYPRIKTKLYEVEGIGQFVMPAREDIETEDVLLYGIPLEYADLHPEGFFLETVEKWTPADRDALASMGIKA